MITPPKLRNDCFALPAGVDWVPLDTALERLRERVHPVVGVENVSLDMAANRIVAQNIMAARANPPAPNSAVDGYGFAGPMLDEVAELPLVDGRAAAGAPYDGTVPAGTAIRILTGAIVPPGVDTVVLQEDTTAAHGRIAFRGPLKKGANTREAGEDVRVGDALFAVGHKLRPQDTALLSAAGVARVPVFRPMRVGVLSNGDEIVAPGTTPAKEMPPGKIYDSNRPMLLAQLAAWGAEAIDLGHVPDNREALRDRLNEAAGTVDAILTSGGVSTGDEDHVSALLGNEGVLETWRIAVKPGRPLALGLWQGIPVFGLPGNPVAAFVCAHIFCRPALGRMAGETWQTPTGFDLPAAFSKNKKPGRREYLRARVNQQGQVEVFPSEGSGRISGLSWADGLVELADDARQITPGDLVRYLPYSSFI